VKQHSLGVPALALNLLSKAWGLEILFFLRVVDWAISVVAATEARRRYSMKENFITSLA
jgi:hypothetical protein